MVGRLEMYYGSTARAIGNTTLVVLVIILYVGEAFSDALIFCLKMQVSFSTEPRKGLVILYQPGTPIPCWLIQGS